MKEKSALYAALITICVALGGVTAAAAQAGPEQGPWGVVQGYCFGCHNSKARTGGLALDSLSPDHIAQMRRRGKPQYASYAEVSCRRPAQSVQTGSL